MNETFIDLFLFFQWLATDLQLAAKFLQSFSMVLLARFLGFGQGQQLGAHKLAGFFRRGFLLQQLFKCNKASSSCCGGRRSKNVENTYFGISGLQLGRCLSDLIDLL
jgi:hypothetical protein